MKKKANKRHHICLLVLILVIIIGYNFVFGGDRSSAVATPVMLTSHPSLPTTTSNTPTSSSTEEPRKKPQRKVPCFNAASTNCYRPKGTWSPASLSSGNALRMSKRLIRSFVADKAKRSQFSSLVGRDACGYQCDMTADCRSAIFWEDLLAPVRTSNISPQLQKEIEELEHMGRSSGMKSKGTSVGHEGDTYQLYTVNMNTTFEGSVCLLSSEEEAVDDTDESSSGPLLYTRPSKTGDMCNVISSKERASKLNELASRAEVPYAFDGCVPDSALKELFTTKKAAPLGNPGYDNSVYIEIRDVPLNYTKLKCMLFCASSSGCVGAHIRTLDKGFSCVLRTVLNINAPVQTDDPAPPLLTMELRFPFLELDHLPDGGDIDTYQHYLGSTTCASTPALEHRADAMRHSALFSCLSPRELDSLYERRPTKGVQRGSVNLQMSSALGMVNTHLCVKWCLSFGLASCFEARMDKGRCVAIIDQDKLPQDEKVDDTNCRALVHDYGDIQERARQRRDRELHSIDEGVLNRKRARESSGDARMSMKESDVEDSIKKFRNDVQRLSRLQGCVTDNEVMSMFRFVEGYDFSRGATMISAAAHSKAECARLCLAHSWCVGGVMSSDGIVCELKSISASTLWFPAKHRVVFFVSQEYRTSEKLKELEAAFTATDKRQEGGNEEDGVVKVEHVDTKNEETSPPEVDRKELSVAYGVSANHNTVQDRLHPMMDTWLKGEKVVVGVDAVDGDGVTSVRSLVKQNPENISATYLKEPIGKDTAITNGKGAWKMFKLFRALVKSHPTADYFVLVDDDTFVVKPNLHQLLRLHSSRAREKTPLYMGRMLGFGPLLSAYVDGASGIILNKAAAQRIELVLDVCEKYLFPFHFGDVRFGYCANYAGLAPTQIESSFTNEPLQRIADHPHLFSDVELPTALHQYRTREDFETTQAALDEALKKQMNHQGVSKKKLLRHFTRKMV